MSRFQILCLSGGGFRGLFTARVLAALEEKSKEPLHQRFDLIAGTSIGGIIALGLAAGRSAAAIADLFQSKGAQIFSNRPPPGKAGTLRRIMSHLRSPLYDPRPLKETINSILLDGARISDLKTRVIIPAVNLSKGKPQVFKTPHHVRFERDHRLSACDVALATSAAPTFFPPHSIGDESFVDGGLYANSPDELALHEALHFLQRPVEEVHVLSIGTTTSNFAWSKARLASVGFLDWAENSRLMSASIGSQQLNADYVLRHRLGERYIRLDAEPSHEQARQLGLDVASPSAISDLNAMAEAKARASLGDPSLVAMLAHARSAPQFFYGGG